MERLTITPGLRYDHLSVTDDDLLSPSLGLTYQLSDDTLLRGSVGHGFRKPYPTLIEGDPYFHITNPNLESETIWSYQAGVETTRFSFARLKATLFDHQATDVWIHDPDTWAWVNDGDFERQGLELEAQSATFHNFSVNAGGMYVLLEPEQGGGQTPCTPPTCSSSMTTPSGASRSSVIISGWTEGLEGLTYDAEETGTFLWDAVAGWRFKA